jgi:hypothetical protein
MPGRTAMAALLGVVNAESRLAESVASARGREVVAQVEIGSRV